MADTPSDSQSETAAALAAGRWLFAQGTVFRKGVPALEFLPDADRIEIAFAGRSNVGKSSLINALTGHKNLARTSSTPGRTQELNFFALAPNRSPDENGVLWIVDMPGYGYARESKTKIAAWNKLLVQYLMGRPTLRRVFVLIDARHGLKKNDLAQLDDLDKAAVPYQIILTKSDKPKKGDLTDCVENVKKAIEKRPAAHPIIHLTSSEKNLGIDELKAEIATLVDLPSIGYKA